MPSAKSLKPGATAWSTDLPIPANDECLSCRWNSGALWWDRGSLPAESQFCVCSGHLKRLWGSPAYPVLSRGLPVLHPVKLWSHSVEQTKDPQYFFGPLIPMLHFDIIGVYCGALDSDGSSKIQRPLVRNKCPSCLSSCFLLFLPSSFYPSLCLPLGSSLPPSPQYGCDWILKFLSKRKRAQNLLSEAVSLGTCPR